MRLFKPVGETRERICITISDIWVRKKFVLAYLQFRPTLGWAYNRPETPLVAPLHHKINFGIVEECITNIREGWSRIADARNFFSSRERGVLQVVLEMDDQDA